MQCGTNNNIELAVQLRAGHYGLLVHYNPYRDHEVEVQYICGSHILIINDTIRDSHTCSDLDIVLAENGHVKSATRFAGCLLIQCSKKGSHTKRQLS